MSRRPTVAATQAAASKAEEAADALVAWLRAQPRGNSPHPQVGKPRAEPLAVTSGADAIELDPLFTAAVPLEPPDPTGGSASTPARDATRPEPWAPMKLDHSDWLHHRLTIIGPATDLAALRTAAAGAGTVPWYLDFDRMEEDLFHLLVSPPARVGALSAPSRSLSLAGARILAGQLRDAAAHRHALAIARVGQSVACPFDLHALVPVPAAILRLGPDEPETLDWLWTHWGTTQTLRHVVEDEAAAGILAIRQPAVAGEAIWVLTFWSADWTPWRSLAQIAARWPMLWFDTQPTYQMP